MTKAHEHDDRTVYYSFNADSRSTHEYGRISETNGSDLCHGTDGLIVAAKVVQKRIRSLSVGVVERMKDTTAKMVRLFLERAVTVTWSPAFRVYEIDFGWGPPKKVELASIALTGAMSMAESWCDRTGSWTFFAFYSKRV